DLLHLLSDTHRFALRNRHIIDLAPLQVYLSAILFAPSSSIIRQKYDNDLGTYLDLKILPNVPLTWNAEVQKLEGHGGGVPTVAFSPDSKMLASGSYDGTVRLWEVATGEEVQKLEGYNGVIWAIAFSSDGKMLASGSDDMTVRLWEMLASGSYDRTVRLWEVATGKEVQKLEGHGGVLAVAFSPDGKMLASGSHDRTVRLWEVVTGKEVQKLEGHDVGVLAVAFSPDSKMLASGSDDKIVRLWEVATGEEYLIFDIDTVVSKAHFSGDGRYLEINSGRIDLDSYICPDRGHVSAPQVVVLTVNNQWIRRNGLDVVWLPHEFRPCGYHSDLWDAWRSHLAIGHASGTVSFFKFRDNVSEHGC
ncbi:WD40 repeat-like protein, partial [Polychaeton citri CBS 116435]